MCVCVCVHSCACVDGAMLSILHIQVMSYLPAALSEAVMVELVLGLSAVSVAHNCCSAWTASCLA